MDNSFDKPLAIYRKVCAIVQARVTSTRLPGKIFEEIEGIPIIDIIINRLRECRELHDIVLAIPDTEGNDSLEEYAISRGVKYFRGSEDDVLRRFFQAADYFGVTDIVRITGDCPLIDPDIIDSAIREKVCYYYEWFDYVGVGVKGGFPDGVDVEVFSFRVLDKINRQARSGYDREHVTPYIYNHPELFKIKFIEADEKIRRPELKFSVDTQEDLDLVREIFKSRQVYSTEAVVDFFDRLFKTVYYSRQPNSIVRTEILQ